MYDGSVDESHRRSKSSYHQIIKSSNHQVDGDDRWHDIIQTFHVWHLLPPAATTTLGPRQPRPQPAIPYLPLSLPG